MRTHDDESVGHDLGWPEEVFFNFMGTKTKPPAGTVPAGGLRRRTDEEIN